MLTQNEIMSFNECISDVEEFLSFFEDKHLRFQNFDMGVLEDGDGYCVETEYIGGIGYPKKVSRIITTRLYISRDLSDYLNMEFSFPVDKVKNEGRLVKQLFMLTQGKFQLSDEEMYFALDKEYFTVLVCVNIRRFAQEEYTEFLETLKYILDCTMHMLTNDEALDKQYYINAVSEQLLV